MYKAQLGNPIFNKWRCSIHGSWMSPEPRNCPIGTKATNDKDKRGGGTSNNASLEDQGLGLHCFGISPYISALA